MPSFFLTDLADNFPGPGQDNAGNDQIFGGEGNDRVQGGNGDDDVDGGLDTDTLYGGAGNDDLNAGALPFEDVLDGGSGIDTATIDYSNVINLGTNESVRIVAVHANVPWSVLVDGFLGVRMTRVERLNIASGDNDDSLVGGNLGDTLDCGGGTDVVRGGNGNDAVIKSWGDYGNLDGGAGIDTLAVSGANLKSPDDALLFDAATATIASGTTTIGGFQRFELFSIAGTDLGDTITTGDGGDQLFGFSGDDVLNGRGGADDIRAGDGRDRVDAGGGNDTIDAMVVFGRADGSTADTILGGAGDDHLFVAAGSAVSGVPYSLAACIFVGGIGRDLLELQSLLTTVVDFTGATLNGFERIAYGTQSGGLRMTAAQASGVTDFTMSNARLYLADAGNLRLTGSLDLSAVHLSDGGQFADFSLAFKPVGPGFSGIRVEGGARGDRIIGTAFSDTHSGNGGNDTLSGGESGDALRGGLGADQLTGGLGADGFEYRDIAESSTRLTGRDRILDFKVAEGDRILLVTIDAIADTPLNDAFTFVGSAEFTSAGQLRVYERNGVTYVDMNTGNDLVADMRIVLDGAHALTEAQFLL